VHREYFKHKTTLKRHPMTTYKTNQEQQNMNVNSGVQAWITHRHWWTTTLYSRQVL